MIKVHTHESVSLTIYDEDDSDERREVVTLRYTIDDGRNTNMAAETANPELYAQNKEEIDARVAAFRAMAESKAAAASVVIL